MSIDVAHPTSPTARSLVPSRAAALAAATPETRDRYVDLLRVSSLAIVIVGHTALFGAVALTVLFGLSQLAVGSAAWWLLRPPWVVLLLLLTAALVLVFRSADRPRAASVAAGPSAAAAGPSAGLRTAVATAGMILCVVGILGLSAVGFGGLLAGRTGTLVVVPVTPLVSAAILVGGAAFLQAAGAIRKSSAARAPAQPG